jgi:hypothetical protein
MEIAEIKEIQRQRNLQTNERWVFLPQYIDATMDLASIGNFENLLCL